MDEHTPQHELDGYLFSDMGDAVEEIAVCVEHRNSLPCRTCLFGNPASVPYSADRSVVAAVRSYQNPDSNDVLEAASEPVAFDIESVSEGLRVITRRLEGAGAEPVGGGLGGEFGYGVHYENSTFGIHSYCWCEEPECPWCLPCTCPDEAHRYFVGDVPMDSHAYNALSVEEFLLLDVTVVKLPELACEFCTGAKTPAANFWHVASGSTVSWYKYIGRGMQVELHERWDEVLLESLTSIKTTEVQSPDVEGPGKQESQ